MNGSRRAADAVEIGLLVLTGYALHLYYNLVGHLASLRGVDYGALLSTFADRAIPYMPFWVNFYQLAYLMPGVVLLLLLLRWGPDVPAVRRLLVSFVALLAVHYALYLAFPTSARFVRLEADRLGEGILGSLVGYQYRLATPWCAWPSLHVSACWFFYRLLLRERRVAGRVYLAWFAGMFVGTAAIKIHYVLDGVTGLVLGECAYRFVLVPLEGTGAFSSFGSRRWPRLLIHAAVLALLLSGIPVVMRLSGFDGPLYTVF